MATREAPVWGRGGLHSCTRTRTHTHTHTHTRTRSLSLSLDFSSLCEEANLKRGFVHHKVHLELVLRVCRLEHLDLQSFNDKAQQVPPVSTEKRALACVRSSACQHTLTHSHTHSHTSNTHTHLSCAGEVWVVEDNGARFEIAQHARKPRGRHADVREMKGHHRSQCLWLEHVVVGVEVLTQS